MRSEITLSTDDPEVAWEATGRLYGITPPITYRGNYREFRCSAVSTRVGRIAVDVIQRSNLAAAAKIPPIDCFMTVAVQAGGMRFSAGQDEWTASPGAPARYSSERAMAKTWGDVSAKVLRLPMDVVRQAVRDSGADAGSFRFTSDSPVSAAMARYWIGLTDYVHTELTSPDSAVERYPLLEARLVELVAAGALAAFPNTAEPATARGWVGPSVVRRAQDLMEESAAEPISVSRIADAVGVDTSSLQRAFRRHAGGSPARSLERARLAGARWELATAGVQRSTEVAEVGARWGFPDPAGFLDLLRSEFGVVPDDSLPTDG